MVSVGLILSVTLVFLDVTKWSRECVCFLLLFCGNDRVIDTISNARFSPCVLVLKSRVMESVLWSGV